MSYGRRVFCSWFTVCRKFFMFHHKFLMWSRVKMGSVLCCLVFSVVYTPIWVIISECKRSQIAYVPLIIQFVGEISPCLPLFWRMKELPFSKNFFCKMEMFVVQRFVDYCVSLLLHNIIKWVHTYNCAKALCSRLLINTQTKRSKKENTKNVNAPVQGLSVWFVDYFV